MKYRVKVFAKTNLYSVPETRYIIQKKVLGMWFDCCDGTIDKDWAYNTCAEMNTSYESIIKLIKEKL